MISSKSRVDYQQVVRSISQSMVRLHRPERLLKLILRYLDRDMQVSHAGMMIFKEGREHFIFVGSRGKGRIPASLVKFEKNHPLVTWFSSTKNKKNSVGDYLSYQGLQRNLLEGMKSLPSSIISDWEKTASVMRTLKIELVIPAYFKKDLTGLLLIGPKKSAKAYDADEIGFFEIITKDCAIVVKTTDYQRELHEKNEQLQNHLREIEALRQKEQKTYYEIMRSLASEVYAKDVYTFGHIGQVDRLGYMTAKEMGLDLSGRRKDILSAGLILHDVGKIGIPDHILNKAGRLTEEEWAVMKTHVDKGAKILEPLSDFREVREIVRSHHENYDGSGYPRGLKGEEIPIEARIVAVVDAFHAMVSTRCYSKGRSPEFAFDELKRCAGKQFDPRVVEAFVSAMSREMRKRGVGQMAEAAPI
ncbi:MAG: HD-GYP domain-containing protein [Candidatus Omnitrophica bacterium]|nr:HD-GYP domain-containing protein [Candidatus Omnitrophota bacterium]